MPITQAVFTPAELNRISVLLSKTFNRQFTYTSESSLGNSFMFTDSKRFIYTEDKDNGLAFKAVIYVNEQDQKKRILQISYISFFQEDVLTTMGSLFPNFDKCQESLSYLNPLLVSIKIENTHSDYALSLSLQNFGFYSGDIEELNSHNSILECELIISCRDRHINNSSRKAVGIVSFLPNTLSFDGVYYQDIDTFKAAILLKFFMYLGRKFHDLSPIIPSSIDSYDNLLSALVRLKAVCEMSAI